ncbi:Nuclear aminoacylation-dependent tRNA export pathway component [Hypoxylon texense]
MLESRSALIPLRSIEALSESGKNNSSVDSCSDEHLLVFTGPHSQTVTGSDFKVDEVNKRIQHVSRVSDSAKENTLQDIVAGGPAILSKDGICQLRELASEQQLYLAARKAQVANSETAIRHDGPLAMANVPKISSIPSSAPAGTLPHAKMWENAPEDHLNMGSECRCVTEWRIGNGADGYTKARVGYGGFAGRWKHGSVLRYNINKGSFKTQDLAKFIEMETIKAISMWGNPGVEFKMVDGDQKATFQIQYRDRPEDQEPDDQYGGAYAESFFPQTRPGILYVYEWALNESNKLHLANILAHEIGHILGLRHEFAGVIERRLPSVLWGKPNPKSVMNYFRNAAAWSSVQKQDIQEVKEFYDLPEGHQIVDDGIYMMVCSIAPGYFQF